jgi:hypothetical protein
MRCRIQLFFAAAAAAALLFLSGCGSGSSASNQNNNNPPPPQTGTVNVMLSDDPTEDWATIGVKVLSISLAYNPPNTNVISAPVTVYTAPATPPMINLVQLDQLGEILANATIATGTYNIAYLTLAANNTGSACDVLLVASGDPEAGFDVPAGTTVPCSQIVIAGATGSAPNRTVPLTIQLATPLVVTSTGSNALDLEFDLRHPALIVEHDPAGATAPTWVVNFNGPVRQHPRADLTKLVLRHLYGQVASVSSDNTAITINRAFPTLPIASPETASVNANDSLSILADATNGTLYYDLDNTTAPATIDNFSSVASTLPGLFTRIVARYQSDGTLVAARVYTASTFDKIWKNPEGHVLHVNTTTNVMHVSTEDGGATAVKIDSGTLFYSKASNTVIGTGATFFDGLTPGGLPNLARGFKVNVVLNPTSTTTPQAAQSVEIDVARYDGSLTSSSAGIDLMRNFPNTDGRGGKDNYKGTIPFATGPTIDQQGNADPNGFYWWNLGFPTLEDTTSTAASDFVSATGGVVNFCQGAALQPVGLSRATWDDPAANDSWAAEWAVLLPVQSLLGTDTTALSFASSANGTTGSFTYTVPLPCPAPGAQPVTVNLNATSGSATLVYQVDSTNGIDTITPVDISTSTGQTTLSAALVPNKTRVKVFGVPESGGAIQAYVLFYYTGTASTK